MPEALVVLIARLDAILDDLQSTALAYRTEIDGACPQHRAGALNLVHYAALRTSDLRGLQNDLMDLGATSLATAEANVRAKVQAARNVLAALAGDPGPWQLEAINHALDEGDQILAANATALFGPPRPGRRTRIMVTVPSEAAGDPSLAAAFVNAGMDVARINCAHDGPQQWEQMIRRIRQAALEAGRTVCISMDVAGPKLRTGPIADGPAVGRSRVTRDQTGQTVAPARLWLVAHDRPGGIEAAPSSSGHGSLPIGVDLDWLNARRPGEIVRLRDTRGLRRSFTIVDVTALGVLAEGQRSAYVAEGAVLECGGRTTLARGIPRLARRIILAAGDRLVLTSDLTPVAPPAAGETGRIGCSLPEAVAAVRVGQRVLFDDGAIEAVVESKRPEEATLRIIKTKPGGQHLGAEKGINVPETDLPLPALTAEDASYLPFIAANADILAVSFVRSVRDVDQVFSELNVIGAEQLGVVLKIETAPGFEELPSILLSAMRRRRLGVMIARGDLAVEIGFERLSEVPRQILALCEAAHVPAIWATQVLETMAKTGVPSRAEITDAATAQRSECVMLNKGPHIPESIRVLDDILQRVGENQQKSRTLMRHIHSWDHQ